MSRPGPEVTEFVLLTTQRSGSTFFRLWLNSHPNVRCHSEVFLKKYRAADGFRPYCEINKGRRLLYHALGKYRVAKPLYDLGMKGVIEGFLHKLYNDPSFSAPWTDMTTDAWEEYQTRENLDLERAAGFQLMYNQLAAYKPLQGWITNPNISIVHLIRENALKLLLSRVTAKKTKQYQFTDGSRPKVYLDPRNILAQLDEIVVEREKMKEFPDNPYLEITYEEFFSDHFEPEDLFAFLGIERAEMKSPEFLKKLNPDSLENLIENYDEIAAVLKGTPHQKFLDQSDSSTVEFLQQSQLFVG